MPSYIDLGELSPLNDLDITILLEDINTTTGTRTAITSGTVTGFISTSPNPDATAADATLSVSGVHVGGNDQYTGGPDYDSGTWLFHLDASALTIALLDSLFNGTTTPTPYFIVSKSNAVRKVGRLTYVRSSTGSIDE